MLALIILVCFSSFESSFEKKIVPPYLLVVGKPETTYFTVHYILTCATQNEFNYIIKLMEADVLSDDSLGIVQGKSNGTAEGFVTGNDKGDGDLTYEPYAQILHNCGGEDQTTNIVLNPMCQVGIPKCSYKISLNLTD